ncbi:hypothetical protein [Microbacterium sp. Leaf151]|uniref:hypothetical protein n=1 Tax=Microbacterium sp. Leaf151 TaxID=1736276 RepID=UPI000701BAD3|nr:hypothetical protein [Microbacterium sp. Leaf151]KQR21390.1 hypothetical protein ASF76_14160 [Microbacterium sp. Leaf151]
MTEVPPPTRRARKDTTASGGDTAVGARAEDSAPAEPGAASTTRTIAAPGGSPAVPATAASGAAVSAPSVPPFDDDPERLPTAQLEMAAFGDHLIPYVPPVPPAPPSLAPWALALATVALLGSLFTGWLLPLGVTGVIFATLSLRRPHDSRRSAVWALCLAVLSLVFSVGWLVWGFSQLAVV